MSNYESVRGAILEAELSEDDLLELNRIIVAEIKEARQRQARRNIHKLRAGAKAKVTGRLRADAYLGEVGEVVETKKTRVVMRFPSDNGRTVTIPASVLAPVDE